MFKSAGQRAAFFAALKKKKQGMDNPAANAMSPTQKPINLQNIGQPPPLVAPTPDIDNKVPKFGKLKKIMKFKV